LDERPTSGDSKTLVGVNPEDVQENRLTGEKKRKSKGEKILAQERIKESQNWKKGYLGKTL